MLKNLEINVKNVKNVKKVTKPKKEVEKFGNMNRLFRDVKSIFV